MVFVIYYEKARVKFTYLAQDISRETRVIFAHMLKNVKSTWIVRFLQLPTIDSRIVSCISHECYELLLSCYYKNI